MWFQSIISYWLGILLLFTALPGNEQRSAVVEYSFANGSKVSITGMTNVKGFTCLSDEFFSNMRATVYTDDSGTAMHFKNAVLQVNVASLDCRNRGMNNDLFRALKADQYPYISVKLEDARPADGSSFDLSDWGGLIIHANITLAGVTQPAEIVFQGRQIGNDRFRFTGKHTLCMSSFGIRPPTALFGAIHVQDAIEVKFDLLVITHIIQQQAGSIMSSI